MFRVPPAAVSYSKNEAFVKTMIVRVIINLFERFSFVSFILIPFMFGMYSCSMLIFYELEMHTRIQQNWSQLFETHV